jgi:hypothetical protein
MTQTERTLKTLRRVRRLLADCEGGDAEALLCLTDAVIERLEAACEERWTLAD